MDVVGSWVSGFASVSGVYWRTTYPVGLWYSLHPWFCCWFFMCMCACIHVRGWCTSTELMQRSEDNFLESIFPTFMWALGIKLRIPGLYDRCHYPLGHLTGPCYHFFLPLYFCLHLAWAWQEKEGVLLQCSNAPCRWQLRAWTSLCAEGMSKQPVHSRVSSKQHVLCSHHSRAWSLTGCQTPCTLLPSSLQGKLNESVPRHSPQNSVSKCWPHGEGQHGENPEENWGGILLARAPAPTAAVEQQGRAVWNVFLGAGPLCCRLRSAL